MRHSASEVDWSKLSERARWALDNVIPRLIDGYGLEQIAEQLDCAPAEVEQAHELLEAETQALAGRIVLPEHTEDEYEALKESIAAHGQIYPILYGSDLLIVDGRGRLRACRELDLEPKTLVLALPASKLQSLALAVNVARRHLTASARRGIIRAELLRDPSRSDRLVARACGGDGKTVAKIRAELEATAEIPQLPERAGADGKVRSAPGDRERPAPLHRTIRVNVPSDVFEQFVGRWVECRAFRISETRPNVYELQVQLLGVAPADAETQQHVLGEAGALDRLMGLEAGTSLAQLLRDASEIFGRPIDSAADLTASDAEWCFSRLGELALMVQEASAA